VHAWCSACAPAPALDSRKMPMTPEHHAANADSYDLRNALAFRYVVPSDSWFHRKDVSILAQYVSDAGCLASLFALLYDSSLRALWGSGGMPERQLISVYDPR